MNAKATQVTTGEVRISYEHLLKPYSMDGKEENAKYSATLLIPKSDTATKARLDAAIQAAIQEGQAGKWGGAKVAQPSIPLHDGDGPRQNGELYGPECAGCWVMTASSKQQQEIVDRNLNPIIDATQIYSGMYARVASRWAAGSPLRTPLAIRWAAWIRSPACRCRLRIWPGVLV